MKNEERCPVCSDGPRTLGHLTWFHNTSQLANFIMNGTKSERDNTVQFIFGGEKTKQRLRKDWENK